MNKSVEKAMSILAKRDKTEYEMKEALKKAGFDHNEIEDTLSYLKEKKYINDNNYAERFVEISLEKKRGPYRIRRELKQKGVDSFVIDDAIYNVMDEDWEINTAKLIADTINRKNVGLKQEKILAKIINKLRYEGFSDSVISEISNELYNDELD